MGLKMKKELNGLKNRHNKEEKNAEDNNSKQIGGRGVRHFCLILRSCQILFGEK